MRLLKKGFEQHLVERKEAIQLNSRQRNGEISVKIQPLRAYILKFEFVRET